MKYPLNLTRENMRQTLLTLPLLCLLCVSCGQTSSTPRNTDSKLIRRVKAVQEQMMRQGNISEEEQKVLRSFAALIMKDTYDSRSVNNKHSIDEVENAPVFPGCEGLSPAAGKKCFKEKVAQLVKTEFDFNIPKSLKNLKSHQVEVFFMVNKDGEISNLKVRKTDIQIQAEATRILRKIPHMKPATHQGKKVAVLYSFPIVWGNKQ